MNDYMLNQGNEATEFLEIGYSLDYFRTQNGKNVPVFNFPLENGIEFVFAWGYIPEKQYGGQYLNGLWLACADYRCEQPEYYELSFQPESIGRALTSIKRYSPGKTVFTANMEAQFYAEYGDIIKERIRGCNAEIKRALFPFIREHAYQNECREEEIQPCADFRTMTLHLF